MVLLFFSLNSLLSLKQCGHMLKYLFGTSMTCTDVHDVGEVTQYQFICYFAGECRMCAQESDVQHSYACRNDP